MQQDLQCKEETKLVPARTLAAPQNPKKNDDARMPWTDTVLLTPPRQVRRKPIQCITSNTKANVQPLEKYGIVYRIECGTIIIIRQLVSRHNVNYNQQLKIAN